MMTMAPVDGVDVGMALGANTTRFLVVILLFLLSWLLCLLDYSLPSAVDCYLQIPGLIVAVAINT
jgi:hypothetical protein